MTETTTNTPVTDRPTIASGTNNPSSGNVSDQSATQLYSFHLPGKYKLPEFDYNNPEIWFAAADCIFDSNAVVSEQAKFAALLQHLDDTRLKHIGSLITNR